MITKNTSPPDPTTRKEVTFMDKAQVRVRRLVSARELTFAMRAPKVYRLLSAGQPISPGPDPGAPKPDRRRSSVAAPVLGSFPDTGRDRQLNIHGGLSARSYVIRPEDVRLEMPRSLHLVPEAAPNYQHPR